jgi:alpha-tubulin suppressor-like RCC1 family protein
VITPTQRASGPFRIGATYLYICAVALDQQTYCMGGNERGELGFTGPGAGTFTQPVSNGRLTNVSPSIHHACGLDAEGVAWGWGDNGYGQLGAGSSAAYSATPLRAGANLRFRSVSPR